MRSKIQITKKKTEPRRADVILKATALLYLQEALIGERYEEAPDLIRQAYGYGAKREEVRKVIDRYLRKRKAFLGNEDQMKAGQRRF